MAVRTWERTESAEGAGQEASARADLTVSTTAVPKPGAVIDADQHLSEPRTMWADFTEASRRHLCLGITEDERGYSWLCQGDRKVYLAEINHPGDPRAMARHRQRLRRGLPPEVAYDDGLVPEMWDPVARTRQLDGFGLSRAVVFPNFGLLWERPLAGDLEATRVNMAAWNRWAVTVHAESTGRLLPVGHVTLRDLDWLDHQLGELAAGDVRLAMVAPSLVDGLPLSHPDLDRGWSAFLQHGVTPVFHVAAFPTFPFDHAWYHDIPDPVDSPMSSVFLGTAPALAIADLVLHGTFERHPDLKLGVMELTATWVPSFLQMLDGGFSYYRAFHGEPYSDLSLRPSEYVRRQVRLAAFGYEDPARLAEESAADLFMFCSDYPHAEGVVRPIEDYVALAGDVGGEAGERLFGDNLRWLVGL